jgi:cyclic pyranopterin phosphate synthase
MAKQPTDASSTSAEGFSHLDQRGQLRMVDVSDKRTSTRVAVAAGEVRMRADTLTRLLGGDVPKGDVLACARVAGIAAAKRTAELIPLCHPLALSWIDVRVVGAPVEGEEGRLLIEATAKARDATGVEMEALTAASVCALTIYDMCKALDPAMTIEGLRLLRKTGGKSDFERQEQRDGASKALEDER